MKKTILFLFSIVIISIAFSQTPGIRWQRTIGSPSEDDYFFTVKTNDNGVITFGLERPSGVEAYFIRKFNKDRVMLWQKEVGAGIFQIPLRGRSYVYNSDGSLVVLCYSTDGEALFFAAKIDKDGNILWQGGIGPSDSAPSQMIRSINGGYLLVGNTTGGGLGGFHGGTTDGWVVKVNELGGIDWYKCLGGSSLEGSDRRQGRGKVAEAADGSIYFLTETLSTNGEATGNHGASDLMLVKLNSGGAVQWSKCLGGASYEMAVDLKLTPSGDICVFGNSNSPELTINGGTQFNLYFARITPAGDLVFQKCYGSTGGEEPIALGSADNNGYVMIGTTSGNDGDVQGFHGSTGSTDIWICKIDNTGNILWQKSIGGSGNEYIKKDPENANIYFEWQRTSGDVLQTSDGGYLITGSTNSSDGDATGIHPTSNRSPFWEDILVAKVSSSGTLEWTRCLGGSERDLPKGLPVEIAPGNYLIGGHTLSANGDVQDQNGKGDGWLIALGTVNTIKGTVFIDQNSNGVKDIGEPPFSDLKIDLSKGPDNWIVVPYNGSFFATSDTGSYVSKVLLDRPYYNVVPAQHTSNFSTYFNTDSFSFALQPVTAQKDLVVDVSPITPARPGFLMDYEISYKNAGNVSIPGGQILFKKDTRLQFVSAVPAISSSNGDTLKWNFTNIDPGTKGLISLKVALAPPPAVNIGDSVISTAIITPVAGDVTPADDTTLVRQIVQGSYDPNDKAETAGIISQAQIATGDYLNYVIRFQNTGNDLAFNIKVSDTLDANLDWSSFEMVGSSHPYQLEINDGNKLLWSFDNILLLDSVHNAPASHGYIAYRIKPNPTLVNGNQMRNKASIYFDFNLPVVTNETVTRVGVNPLVLPLHLLSFDANFRKPDALLDWSTADESNVDKFIVERGTDPIHFVPVGSVAAKGNSNSITRYQFKDALASASGDKFYYRLKMTDHDQKFTYSNIQLVKREGRAVNELLVNPNPIKGRFGFAWINLQREARAEIGVIDMKGNYRSLVQQQINKGFNVVPLDFFGLSSGTYLLQVKIGQERLTSRFVLVQ